MRLALMGTSQWAGRQFRLRGFSWSTNQRVFLIVRASALLSLDAVVKTA